MALFLFAATLITGGFVATEYEACKADGITEEKACIERLWNEREPLDYSKLND